MTGSAIVAGAGFTRHLAGDGAGGGFTPGPALAESAASLLDGRAAPEPRSGPGRRAASGQGPRTGVDDFAVRDGG